MNKCYRLVFNRCNGVWQAVAENVASHGRGGYKLMAGALLTAVMPLAQAIAPPPATDEPGVTIVELAPSTRSHARAISADGTTLVGLGYNTGGNAYYWSAASGVVNFHASLNTTGHSQANAVNADGTVIVGMAVKDRNSAFRWSASGVTYLGTLGGTISDYSQAYGVSADGSVVVGESSNDGGISYNSHAFRWDTTSQQMTQLFTTIGKDTPYSSAAYAISSNGHVIVGKYTSRDDYRTIAFRWENDVVESLEALDHSNNTNWQSEANDVNTDGSVIVGYTTNTGSYGKRYEAFRWTTDGMVGLGVLADFDTSRAQGINSTGDVVVGNLTSSDASTGFRWTQETGMQTIEQWLADSGVDTSDISGSISSAVDVNADGTVIVGDLRKNGITNAYLARAKSGIIDVAAFNTSLARTAASAIIAENQNDMVFHGMHGNPMQMLLGVDKSGFWLAGDFGRQNRDARKADMGVGEIGYGHRFNEALQMNIAAGYTHSIAGTDNGGQTRVKSLFVLPELMVSLPGSLYATFSGIYSKGTANIDRGYENAGKRDLSQGSPDTQSIGARVRLDWHDMASIGGMTLTPYMGLSYLQTTFDAYTETGGGFAARWNKRKEKASTARAGLDVAKAVSDNVKITGRIEGVHRFQKKNAGATGTSDVLGGFAFSGQKLKRNWLRAGAGFDGRIGSGTASVTLNATTEGEVAAYWMAVNYRWQF